MSISERHQTLKYGFGVFFIVKKVERRNPIEKKNLRNHYDLDGCYSLLIAITLNVGASKAWSLYAQGHKQKSGCITRQSRDSGAIGTK